MRTKGSDHHRLCCYQGFDIQELTTENDTSNLPIQHAKPRLLKVAKAADLLKIRVRKWRALRKNQGLFRVQSLAKGVAFAGWFDPDDDANPSMTGLLVTTLVPKDDTRALKTQPRCATVAKK